MIPTKLIAQLRHEYKYSELIEKNIQKNPFRQFENWLAEALLKDKFYANAMTVATVGKNAKPSSRVVLLKGFDESGFTFFTNYQSRKGKELEKNPFASLTFFWKELHRQVHIEGRVKKISASASDEYFQTRPRGSRLSASVSPQSKIISGRNILEEKIKVMMQQTGNQIIPRPENWGGYILIPERIEFWQGRENRLHDRILYSRQKNSRWKVQRLAP